MNFSEHRVRRDAEKQVDKARDEYANKLKCINFEHAELKKQTEDNDKRTGQAHPFRRHWQLSALVHMFVSTKTSVQASGRTQGLLVGSRVSVAVQYSMFH
jgi:hypothetical protein